MASGHFIVTPIVSAGFAFRSNSNQALGYAAYDAAFGPTSGPLSIFARVANHPGGAWGGKDINIAPILSFVEYDGDGAPIAGWMLGNFADEFCFRAYKGVANAGDVTGVKGSSTSICDDAAVADWTAIAAAGQLFYIYESDAVSGSNYTKNGVYRITAVDASGGPTCTPAPHVGNGANFKWKILDGTTIRVAGSVGSFDAAFVNNWPGKILHLTFSKKSGAAAHGDWKVSVNGTSLDSSSFKHGDFGNMVAPASPTRLGVFAQITNDVPVPDAYAMGTSSAYVALYATEFTTQQHSDLGTGALDPEDATLQSALLYRTLGKLGPNDYCAIQDGDAIADPLTGRTTTWRAPAETGFYCMPYARATQDRYTARMVGISEHPDCAVQWNDKLYVTQVGMKLCRHTMAFDRYTGAYLATLGHAGSVSFAVSNTALSLFNDLLIGQMHFAPIIFASEQQLYFLAQTSIQGMGTGILARRMPKSGTTWTLPAQTTISGLSITVNSVSMVRGGYWGSGRAFVVNAATPTERVIFCGSLADTNNANICGGFAYSDDLYAAADSGAVTWTWVPIVFYSESQNYTVPLMGGGRDFLVAPVTGLYGEGRIGFVYSIDRGASWYWVRNGAADYSVPATGVASDNANIDAYWQNEVSGGNGWWRPYSIIADEPSRKFIVSLVESTDSSSPWPLFTAPSGKPNGTASIAFYLVDVGGGPSDTGTKVTKFGPFWTGTIGRDLGCEIWWREPAKSVYIARLLPDTSTGTAEVGSYEDRPNFGTSLAIYTLDITDALASPVHVASIAIPAGGNAQAFTDRFPIYSVALAENLACTTNGTATVVVPDGSDLSNVSTSGSDSLYLDGHTDGVGGTGWFRITGKDDSAPGKSLTVTPSPATGTTTGSVWQGTLHEYGWGDHQRIAAARKIAGTNQLVLSLADQRVTGTNQALQPGRIAFVELSEVLEVAGAVAASGDGSGGSSIGF